MTDNQNINNTSMKHVQQEHFLYKTAITMYSDWNVSENFVFFLFVCSSFFFFLPAWHFKVDERWIKASVVDKLSVDKQISRCCISFHAWIQWIYLTRLFLVFECDYERVTKQKKKKKALEIYFRNFYLKPSTRNFNLDFNSSNSVGCP